MSDFKLALVYLRSRTLVTLLTIASVALGLALATVVLLVARETENTLMQESGYWDVVVGAKGSPLQVALNVLYYLDAPTGNIDIKVWNTLQHDDAVKQIVPINMGDSYYGAPIVGTTMDIFAPRIEAGERILAQGQGFSKPFEAVVGADVARRNQLRLGQHFAGSHGWTASNDVHTESPYTVVGILALTGTSMDRAVYTDYRSVWEVHSHHDAHDSPAEVAASRRAYSMVTALLVRLTQPGRRFRFIEKVNAQQTAMAVIPVDQVSALAQKLIVPLQQLLISVAYLVVFVAGLSILISLYLTIHQRRRDIAILRSLGATQGDIFRLITLEAAMLAGLGVLAGWLIGHGVVAACVPYTLAHYGIAPHAWQVAPAEFLIAGSVWVLGILAGLLPAAIAYRVPVAETIVQE